MFQSPDEDSIIPEVTALAITETQQSLFQSPDEDSIIPELRIDDSLMMALVGSFSPLTRIRSSRRTTYLNMWDQIVEKFQSPDEDSIIPEATMRFMSIAWMSLFQSPDEDSIIPERLQRECHALDNVQFQSPDEDSIIPEW